MKVDKYLQKAILIFKTEGLSIPIDTIAEKIGVTKKTLYNNFESKDGLIKRCMEKVLHDFCTSVECLNDTSKDVQECFIQGINAARNYFREISPVFLNEMLKFYPLLANDDHNLGYKFFIEQLEKNIIRGQRENVYREDIDASLIAGYIAYSIFAYFRKSVMMNNKSSAEHYFKQVIDYNLKALLIS